MFFSFQMFPGNCKHVVTFIIRKGKKEMRSFERISRVMIYLTVLTFTVVLTLVLPSTAQVMVTVLPDLTAVTTPF